MEDRKVLSVIISALVVGFFVAAAVLTNGGDSVLAQGDPSSRLSSGPLGDGSSEGPVTMGEEEAIDPEEFGPNAPEAIADFRVTGSVLRPRATNVDYTWGAGGGCIYATSGNDFTVFNTPLSLPQGSEVLGLRMYYDDTNASDNSVGWFSIYDLYGSLVDEWSVQSNGSTGNGFRDSDPINHTIDYGSYSYLLNWRPVDLGSDMQLCGFRIFYEPPPFGLQLLPNVVKQ